MLSVVAQDITETTECANRPQPTVRVGGVVKVINEDNFERYDGSYPPVTDGDRGNGIDYYVLDRVKSILYVSDFLNKTASTELKDFCISGNRFARSPIRGYGHQAGVSESNVRTR